MFRLLFAAFAGYLLIMAVMYLFQRQLEYSPDTHPPGSPQNSNVPEMREVTATTEDGLKLVAWFAAPKIKGGKIVVLYHGNAGNISGRAIKARAFLERGYGVYMCEYRGFGGNSGFPSEQGFYKDARSALKWLEAQGYSPSQFVIYGESIGSGAAVQMALEIQPKSLILEAPLSSAIDVARMRYPWLPVDLLLKDRFENAAKIDKIHASLLIVHGDEDTVVPIILSQKLFNLAHHPKEYVTVNGGAHSDLYDHHAGHIITQWLDKQP
jgi:hypothetical protein